MATSCLQELEITSQEAEHTDNRNISQRIKHYDDEERAYGGMRVLTLMTRVLIGLLNSFNVAITFPKKGDVECVYNENWDAPGKRKRR